MNAAELRELVGAVRDPHLPFGLAELGMLERLDVSACGAVDVVVNVPCHHCPGLQMLDDEIRGVLRRAGVQAAVSISFQGRAEWTPAAISPRARTAMRHMGIQMIATAPSGR